MGHHGAYREKGHGSPSKNQEETRLKLMEGPATSGVRLLGEDGNLLTLSLLRRERPCTRPRTVHQFPSAVSRRQTFLRPPTIYGETAKSAWKLRNTRSARDSRWKLVNRPRPSAWSFPPK